MQPMQPMQSISDVVDFHISRQKDKKLIFCKTEYQARKAKEEMKSTGQDYVQRIQDVTIKVISHLYVRGQQYGMNSAKIRVAYWVVMPAGYQLPKKRIKPITLIESIRQTELIDPWAIIRAQGFFYAIRINSCRRISYVDETFKNRAQPDYSWRAHLS